MSAETETGSLLFVDTNILVYAYDRSAGEKHSTARQILEQCWENQNGCASIQVLQEFYVTVTRKIPTPIDLMAARQILADLAVWRIHSPEANDLLQAIDLQRDHQLSFWDAMIVQSAQPGVPAVTFRRPAPRDGLQRCSGDQPILVIAPGSDNQS